MEESRKFEKYGDLMVSIDWISFTIRKSVPVKDAMAYFGFDIAQFQEMPRGLSGYRKRYCHYVDGKGLVQFLADGNNSENDMGVHVDVSGSAVAFFLETFHGYLLADTPWNEKAVQIPENWDFRDAENLISLLFQRIRELGDFTRIDLAVDDFGQFFTVQEVHDLVENKQCVTKFRTFQYYQSKSISDSSLTGETLYIGSKKSDAYVRIYNKGLEQKVDMDWIRWEIQLRDERASAFSDMVLHCEDHENTIAPIIVGVLAGFVRFVNLDDSNRSRCSMLQKWADFIAAASSIVLSVPKKKSSVENKHEWVRKQVMPTIAGLLYAYGGDMSAVFGDLGVQFNRNSLENREMFISAFNNLVEVQEDERSWLR